MPENDRLKTKHDYKVYRTCTISALQNTITHPKAFMPQGGDPDPKKTAGYLGNARIIRQLFGLLDNHTLIQSTSARFIPSQTYYATHMESELGPRQEDLETPPNPWLQPQLGGEKAHRTRCKLFRTYSFGKECLNRNLYPKS